MTPLAAAVNVALLHSLWQDAAIALVLLAAFAVLRSPRSRYAAACAALAAMTLLPVVTAVAAYRQPPLGGTIAIDTGAVDSSTPLEPAVSTSPVIPARDAGLAAIVQPWLLPLWFAGVLVCSIRLAAAGAGAWLLTRDAARADASVERLLVRIAARIGVTSRVTVRWSPRTIGPATIGWLRPIVLLPPATLLGLTPTQLEAVLAHELAHVRRHDYLVNALQLVVETLFFYHPAIWWVSRRIRVERELCCDDEAVRACGDPLDYARALTEVARLTAATPAAAVAMSGGSLVERVQRLVAGRSGGAAAPRSPMLIVLAVAASIVVLMPSWMRAQAAAPAAGGARLSGTLYDPLNQPAANTLVRIVPFGRGGAFHELRTDAGGRFAIDALAPGRYSIRTELTDYVAPESVDIKSGESRSVDVRMSVDETAVNLRVCRDCTAVPLPNGATATAPASDPVTPIVTPAAPAAGWDAFNAAVFPYASGLKTTRVEGHVLVEGRIDSDGTTTDVHVIASPDRRLNAAAMAVVRELRWRPAHVRGLAMATPLHATVEFSLTAD